MGNIRLLCKISKKVIYYIEFFNCANFEDLVNQNKLMKIALSSLKKNVRNAVIGINFHFTNSKNPF